jgi:predicted glutamine amidotransferase
MCGLVGLVCKSMTLDHKKAFRLLLWLDEKRGRHSTGVCYVNEKFEYNYYKALGTSYEMYDTDDKNEFFEKSGLVKEHSPLVLMGHNRHATMGAINVDNAHPFEVNDGHIIGAHNGTLHKGYALWNLKHYTKDKVDSQALYEELSEDGGDMQVTYPKLDGAMALTWVDTKANTFNIARNIQRELNYATLRDQQGIIYASEAWMLQAVFHDYPGLFIPPTTKKEEYDFQTHRVPTNTWFRITLDDIPGALQKAAETAIKLEPYKWTAGQYNAYNQKGGVATNFHKTHGQSYPRPAVPTKGNNAKESAEVFTRSFRGSGGVSSRLKLRGNHDDGFFLQAKSIDLVPDPQDLFTAFGVMIKYVLVKRGPKISRGTWVPDYARNMWRRDTSSTIPDTTGDYDNETDEEPDTQFILFNKQMISLAAAQAIVDTYGCSWCANSDIDLDEEDALTKLHFPKANDNTTFFCCDECNSQFYKFECGYSSYGGVRDL